MLLVTHSHFGVSAFVLACINANSFLLTVFSCFLSCLECSRVTTVTDLHLACLSKQLLPFTLPIPISATPQFCAQNKLLLIDGRWRLRLEFILSRDTEWFALGTKPPGSSTTDSVDGLLPDVWKLPSFLPTEKLAWHLPIQLVSSDPSMMCLPRTTSTMPVLLPVFWSTLFLGNYFVIFLSCFSSSLFSLWLVSCHSFTDYSWFPIRAE